MPLALFRMALFSALLTLLATGLFTGLSTGVGFAQAVTLGNTRPLDWQGPLDERMLDGLHVFVDRKLEESIETRSRSPLGASGARPTRVPQGPDCYPWSVVRSRSVVGGRGRTLIP